MDIEIKVGFGELNPHVLYWDSYNEWNNVENIKNEL